MMPKEIFKFLALFLVIFNLFFSYPQETLAQQLNNIPPKCDKYPGYVEQPAIFPLQANLGQSFNITVTFGRVADPSYNYYIKLTKPGSGPLNNIGNVDVRTSSQTINLATNTAIFSVGASGLGSNADTIGNFNVSLMREARPEEEVCTLGSINFSDPALNNSQCNIKMPSNVEQRKPFDLNIEKTDVSGVTYTLYIFKASDLATTSLPKGVAYKETLAHKPLPELLNIPTSSVLLDQDIPANTSTVTPPDLGYVTTTVNANLDGGNYVAVVSAHKFLGYGLNPQAPIANRWLLNICSSHPFSATREPTDPSDKWTDGSIITTPGTGGTIGGGDFVTETCLKKAEKDPDVKCVESRAKPCGTGGIQTAIGCVHSNPVDLTRDILRFLVAIGGGIALLLMIIGAFGMITSAGNPDNLAASRDRFVKAIEGLLFILFAVLLFKIIGVDILGLPELGAVIPPI